MHLDIMKLQCIFKVLDKLGDAIFYVLIGKLTAMNINKAI